MVVNSGERKGELSPHNCGVFTKAGREGILKSLFINRGDCFRHTGKLHYALSDYEQALELDPVSVGDVDV